MRWTWDAVLFIAMILIAFGGFPYALIKWRGEISKAKIPIWRRTLANIGFLAVGVQAVLFLASWTRIGSDYVLFGLWARWVIPTFVIAVPFVLAGKGAARWWLLSSSVLLFFICFFIALSP
jgi:hypothetical protein